MERRRVICRLQEKNHRDNAALGDSSGSSGDPLNQNVISFGDRIRCNPRFNSADPSSFFPENDQEEMRQMSRKAAVHSQPRPLLIRVP
ncbi:hypothetical protein CEXT_613821 [Caerostris extrusa]|uniref:Uncharacterized protein n=1 Tax=Caerostris extrusa TaxID=172846 RepID=A0AAV4NES3_CAEEX|nr:hypothetical protein CEXT_613821 [Caerostris extrusa]